MPTVDAHSCLSLVALITWRVLLLRAKHLFTRCQTMCDMGGRSSRSGRDWLGFGLARQLP